MSVDSALDAIGDWVADGTLARAAALVLVDGEVAAERVWGTATDGRPLDAETLFPFASLTKPSFATAILRLVERGALRLDLTLGDALPDAPPPIRAITIANLLTHTSGLPEHPPGVGALQARRAPTEAYVHAALEGGLLFEPGTRVLYSNAGFQVLGAMVERLTSAAFPELLAREAFAPLGMRSATMLPLTRPGVRTARVEVPAKLAAHPGTEIWNSAYFKRLARADAGLFATPRDITLLMEAYRLDGAGALAPAIARDAITSRTHGLPGRYGPYEWPSCDFGWSWEIKDGKSPHPTGSRTSARTFGHIGGAGVLAFCDPERALTVVIHTCRDFSDGWAAERPYLVRVATGVVEGVEAARASRDA